MCLLWSPLRRYCAGLKALQQRAARPTLSWLSKHMPGLPSQASLQGRPDDEVRARAS